MDYFLKQLRTLIALAFVAGMLIAWLLDVALFALLDVEPVERIIAGILATGLSLMMYGLVRRPLRVLLPDEKARARMQDSIEASLDD